MAGGFLFHQFLLGGAVGVEQREEDDPQRDHGEPDGPAHQQMAEDRARHGAQDEEKQHPAVAGQLAAVGFVGAVAVPQLLGQPDADLPDVVGGKGGGHRDALGLPEGIVLHRGHKVDDHLADDIFVKNKITSVCHKNVKLK